MLALPDLILENYCTDTRGFTDCFFFFFSLFPACGCVHSLCQWQCAPCSFCPSLFCPMRCCSASPRATICSGLMDLSSTVQLVFLIQNTETVAHFRKLSNNTRVLLSETRSVLMRITCNNQLINVTCNRFVSKQIIIIDWLWPCCMLYYTCFTLCLSVHTFVG